MLYRPRHVLAPQKCLLSDLRQLLKPLDYTVLGSNPFPCVVGLCTLITLDIESMSVSVAGGFVCVCEWEQGTRERRFQSISGDPSFFYFYLKDLVSTLCLLELT